MARPLRIDYTDAVHHPPSISFGETGVIAVDKRGTGDGALRAGIAAWEPAQTKARDEIVAVETTALGG